MGHRAKLQIRKRTQAGREQPRTLAEAIFINVRRGLSQNLHMSPPSIHRILSKAREAGHGFIFAPNPTGPKMDMFIFCMLQVQ